MALGNGGCVYGEKRTCNQQEAEEVGIAQALHGPHPQGPRDFPTRLHLLSIHRVPWLMVGLSLQQVNLEGHTSSKL